MIPTSAHPKELWPGIVAFFGAVYDEHNEEFSEIFDTESSSKAYEERVQQRGFGLAPVKDQGASIQYEGTQAGYTSRIVNITYAIGATITREAIEDNQYESLAPRFARHQAFSIRQTQENVAANVLNRAFNTSYTGGDGKALCVNDHPEANGSQSNLLTVAADLSESALENMLIQIAQATDSKGLKIALIGRKLIVHPGDLFNATRILDSVLRSGTPNNDINAIKKLGLLPDGVTANHYLSDSDAWFVKTNAPEGMIRQVRRAVEFAQDNDFDTENAKMKASIREGYGWGDWRGAFGSPGA